MAARHSPSGGTKFQTPFFPVSFGKSFMKILSAVPENGSHIFGGREKNKKTSVKHICYRLIAGCVKQRNHRYWSISPTNNTCDWLFLRIYVRGNVILHINCTQWDGAHTGMGQHLFDWKSPSTWQRWLSPTVTLLHIGKLIIGLLKVVQGLTSHRTHYRSFQRRVFCKVVKDPTNSINTLKE